MRTVLTWVLRGRTAYHRVGFALVSALTLTGCRDLVNGVEFPKELVDPNSIKTVRGALGLYDGVVTRFPGVLGSSVTSVVRVGGLLSDEVTRVQGASSAPSVPAEKLDARLLSEGLNIGEQLYVQLHGIRTASQEARGVIRTYAPSLPSALTGHLMALEAMAMVYLAELYCSGIPLSTLDFEQDYTLTRGFQTEEVYTRAVALLDSAAPLVKDSARLAGLVQVGKARALLGLGELAAAQVAVNDVPTAFVYEAAFSLTTSWKYVPLAMSTNDMNLRDMFADQEGGTGLPFRTGGDPRTSRPYVTSMTGTITASSGVEARLIEAEALLMAGDAAWLTTLNTLRTTCVDAATCATPAPAGTGGVAGLLPLEDPMPGVPLTDTAAQTARLKVVFAERAYWLYLTGHRQGDLRRLMREYRWPIMSVYPTGPYWFSGYGNDVTLPVPQSEVIDNRLYDGCYHRNA